VREESGASSIVSDRDGVILSATATSGSLQVVPGQVVQAGQTLISGLVDCGIKLCTVRAEGEILAATDRSLTVKIPAQRLVRAEKEGQIKKYSLIIGKNRINFFKGSGISEGSCVKMYLEYVLTLPGGFELPVAFVKECISDSIVADVICAPEAATRLSGFADNYLKKQMVAGVVHSAAEQVEITDDLIRLSGRYVCSEVIGRYQNEMIGEYHGKNDGADRERRSGG
jgi:similar to stage IV sporulation protein